MLPPISPLLCSALLMIGMLIMLEVGRRFGVARRPKESDGERSNLGAIEGAVFALFGLLVAFTFSGAASRFNEKRALIAEEANCIETAYLRANLLPVKSQPEVQALFRDYLASRIETYNRLPDIRAAELEMARSKQIQDDIWTKAIAASQLPNAHPDAGKLLLPALNNMIDITTTRKMALYSHPPVIIYILLFVLGLMCSLLAGYRMAVGKHRSWLHIISFAIITSVVVYVIIDVEYPRAGLIRIQTFDRVLNDVAERIH
jgi:ABC-type glycerol-3-phosphate transport system permease component